MSRVKFEYLDYTRSDGVKIPSVTTIIKILNKPELVDWANFMGFKNINSKKFAEESAVTGTIVHFLIERKCRNKIVPLYLANKGKHPEQVMRCYNLFKKWKAEYNPEFLYNEIRLQTLKLGGTVDCICKISDDIILLDFKTSKDIYPSMFMQLAGYYKLLTEMKPHIAKRITKVAILSMPRKHGADYKFILMDVTHLVNYYVPAFEMLEKFYKLWKDNLQFDWNKNFNL